MRPANRVSTLSRSRRACHGLSYEAWHGNAFDAILSDGVLQLIDISGEGWPIALLPTLLSEACW